MNSLTVLRTNIWLGYALAAILFAITLGARFWIGGNLAGYPFVVFFPAIILTAFLSGTGPGVLIGTLSGLAATYFFMEPVNSFTVAAAADRHAIGFYIIVVGVDLTLIHMLHRQIDAEVLANSERQRLVDYQKVLFAELQHRVANNLAFVSALLSLQKRGLEKDSVAANVLDLAGLRLLAMSRIHRTLYDQSSADQPLASFLSQLTRELLTSAGAENVAIKADGDDVRIDLDRLTTLALLTSEVVTNSAKHVLLKGLGDQLTIQVSRLGDAKVRIEISDNGPGVADCADIWQPGEKLGRSIVQGLIKQLHGEYELVNRNGAVSIITFPISKEEHHEEAVS